MPSYFTISLPHTISSLFVFHLFFFCSSCFPPLRVIFYWLFNISFMCKFRFLPSFIVHSFIYIPIYLQYIFISLIYLFRFWNIILTFWRMLNIFLFSWLSFFFLWINILQIICTRKNIKRRKSKRFSGWMEQNYVMNEQQKVCHFFYYSLTT